MHSREWVGPAAEQKVMAGGGMVHTAGAVLSLTKTAGAATTCVRLYACNVAAQLACWHAQGQGVSTAHQGNFMGMGKTRLLASHLLWLRDRRAAIICKPLSFHHPSLCLFPSHR